MFHVSKEGSFSRNFFLEDFSSGNFFWLHLVSKRNCKKKFFDLICNRLDHQAPSRKKF